MSYPTYIYRKRRGYPLDVCLDKNFNHFKVVDHLGNEYKSKKELTDHYHVGLDTFRRRMYKGSSLEKALTKKGYTASVDHLGNVFKSQAEKCKFWNINLTVYRRRIEMGLSEQQALTAPLTKTRKRKNDIR